MNNVVLSLFGGLDLFGRGFEEAGYCVLRGPDLLWGSDIKNFDGRPLRGKINGIIAGVPCQKFSVCTKKENRKNHENLWPEFWRVVREVDPDWLAGENVFGAEGAAVDMFAVGDYKHKPTFKRLHFTALGSAQHRPRVIVYAGANHREFWRILDEKGFDFGCEWRTKIGRSKPEKIFRTILQNGHTAGNRPAYRTITQHGNQQYTTENGKIIPYKFIKGDDFLDAFDLPSDFELAKHAEISRRTFSKLITQGVPVAAAYSIAMSIKEANKEA